MAKPKAIGVLVTRPKDQNNRLIKLIESAGAMAIVYPTIEIKEPKDKSKLIQIIKELHDYSIAVFISPNAVYTAVAEIHRHRKKIPDSILLACVGKGSADALKAHGYSKNVITPVEKYNSEALLQLPELQHVINKKIVIFRGNGGRNVLRDTLLERGALVDYGECYRRAKPNTDNSMLLEALHDNSINVITTTSAEAMQNLLDMVDAETQQQLKDIPVIVASERIASVTKQLGFKRQILVANNAGDEAMVDRIKQWQASVNTL